MLVGLVADTHDNVHAIRYLVQFFDHEGAEALVHAGDFVSPFTIPELAGFSGPVYGVFGNNDGDRDTIQDQARDRDVDVTGAPRRLGLGNREWLVSHRPSDLPDTIPSEVEIVVHGHTHARTLEDHADYRLVNPGEAGGWLTDTISVALLDTENLECRFHLAPAP